MRNLKFKSRLESHLRKSIFLPPSYSEGRSDVPSQYLGSLTSSPLLYEPGRNLITPFRCHFLPLYLAGFSKQFGTKAILTRRMTLIEDVNVGTRRNEKVGGWRNATKTNTNGEKKRLANIVFLRGDLIPLRAV